MSEHDEGLKKKYNRKKRFFRFRLAIQQLIARPYLNICPLTVLIGFGLFWNDKSQLYVHVPKLILPIWRCMVHIGGTAIFIFLLLSVLYVIGELTARNDEDDLYIAFVRGESYRYCPILISKVHDKDTKVTVREFHSNIPIKRWKENKESIADVMNVHFVKPDLEYGGRNKDNGKRILMYTAKSRKVPERGNLYEDK